jgi:succinate dehydrogenase / fumarate reductase membrane anchor subunit
MRDSQTAMRTPLKNARRLGSAKEGADHFWAQRMSGVANLALVPIMIVVAASLAGADFATVKRTLAHPVIAVTLLLVLVSSLIHMRLGMQTVIEDYLHRDRYKMPLLMLNTFFTIAVGAVCIWAVLKLSFGL